MDANPSSTVIIIAAALSMLVSACGGGGSGGAGTSMVNSPPPPMYLASAPGDSAFSAYLQASHQYSLSAVDNSGDTLTVDISSVPNPGTTSFNGFVGVDSSLDTATLKKNGVLVTTSVSTSYYTLNPYASLGNVSQTGSPYEVLVIHSPIPATVSAGDINTGLDSGTAYHDSTKTLVDGNIGDSYYTGVNNATSLLFCINSQTTNVSAQGLSDGLADATETDCYSDDSSGNINLVSIALVVNGQTLTFK
jgi:hypothetical protein